jgi:hypothetical protein
VGQGDGADDRGGAVVTADNQSRIVAAITENLHRRVLDTTVRIDGDPFTEQEAAEQWLARTGTESQIISEMVDLLDDGDSGYDAVRELVAFAATAVEMWAQATGNDPFLRCCSRSLSSPRLGACHPPDPLQPVSVPLARPHPVHAAPGVLPAAPPDRGLPAVHRLQLGRIDHPEAPALLDEEARGEVAGGVHLAHLHTVAI